MNAIAAAPHGTLTLPNGRTIARPGWSPDPAIVAERLANLRGRYFVVRIGGNAGVGEVWRCKHCHGKHGYFTRNCVELPFNGVEQAVYAVYQQAGDLAAVRALGSPQQRTAAAILKPVMSLPDLASLHPQMAAQRASAGRLEAFDIEVGGIPLGRIEEIPRSLAQRLLTRINQTLPIDARVHIDGLED